MLCRSILRKTTCLQLVTTFRHSSVVTASMVKELREKSGAPMMDCKKALASPEVNGDFAKAIDWLRAKGKARAASGADRVATEGVVALLQDHTSKRITLLEVNSETDFVSRNKDFQLFVSTLAATASSSRFPDGDVDLVELMKAPVSDANKVAGVGTVQDALGDAVNVIR